MVEIPIEALMTGIKLAVIGMAFVFAALFGIEILVRIMGKVFGPKVKVSSEAEVPQSPPATETKQGGG